MDSNPGSELARLGRASADHSVLNAVEGAKSVTPCDNVRFDETPVEVAFVLEKQSCLNGTVGDLVEVSQSAGDLIKDNLKESFKYTFKDIFKVNLKEDFKNNFKDSFKDSFNDNFK